MNEPPKAEPLTCPRCGDALKKFIRVRTNEHVTFCDNQHYAEGKGDSFQAALKDLQRQTAQKQKTLL